ncbi:MULTISPECIES: hypothetical protein [unclassified Geobacillus]|uniref:hypothetical protein n=1 Tax=unclassified Geobacillus TaxID=2642459 RepID=UPI000C28DF59|nr:MULTISPECIES: hypothetical protein [unclassified Geobacillus]PJW13935.1 hypothetical protein CV945_11515 [Geobacillus sp. Manikaran-105]PJW16936.1 hypothetical protein CV944_11885 [Geobacillus sp. WSUCF-018B]
MKKISQKLYPGETITMVFPPDTPAAFEHESSHLVVHGCEVVIPKDKIDRDAVEELLFKIDRNDEITEDEKNYYLYIMNDVLSHCVSVEELYREAESLKQYVIGYLNDLGIEHYHLNFDIGVLHS